MRYELTDYEWAAIRPMLPNKARGVRRVDSTASARCCDPAHHGAICRIVTVHAPPATTVSSGGEGPECGGGSWTHLAAAHDAAVRDPTDAEQKIS